MAWGWESFSHKGKPKCPLPNTVKYIHSRTQQQKERTLGMCMTFKKATLSERKKPDRRVQA
jgi:hypothetical protein